RVEPPGQRDAGRVEGEEHIERELGASGGVDGGAKRARDQIAAARADRGREPQDGGALAARGLHRAALGLGALNLDGAAVLTTETHGAHTEARAVADAGRDE